jgi:hypothetical protein
VARTPAAKRSTRIAARRGAAAGGEYLIRIVSLRGLSLLVWLAVAVSVAACAQPQTRVERTPEALAETIRDARWASFPVHYCLVVSEAGFVSTERLAVLTEEAFRRWAADVVSDGFCDEVSEGNGRNEVAWGSFEMDELGEEGVYRNALTRKLFLSCPDGCAGGAQSELVEADIILAPSPPDELRNEACLFATLLHETGHFLGVPHLESPAVMAPEFAECPQDLTSADRRAMAELYAD